MENEMIKYFLTQGPFAVLFVLLLLWSRKDSKERERNLNGIIEKQNDVLTKFSEKYDMIISEIRELKERFR